MSERREYLVPVTIADERLVTVIARNEAEAKAKVRAGQYKTLGRTLMRGFLLIGTPAEKLPRGVTERFQPPKEGQHGHHAAHGADPGRMVDG